MAAPPRLAALCAAAAAAAPPPTLRWAGSVAGERAWPRAVPPGAVGPPPVVNQSSPGAADNAHGLEGGKAVRVGGVFHVFTAATFGVPYGIMMRLEHWASHDRLRWERRRVLVNSSSVRLGTCKRGDPRAAVWEPVPVYDVTAERWIVYYTGYMCRGNVPGTSPHDPAAGATAWAYNGSVFALRSLTPGREAGIDGPWADAGLAFHGGDQLDYLGTDSFHPYGPAADGRYYALVGQATPRTGHSGGAGCVGIAVAPSIAGPWAWKAGWEAEMRGEASWPYLENPVVDPLPGGGWVALMDTVAGEAQGIAAIYSADGVTWNTTVHRVRVPAGCRTPLGLTPVADTAPRRLALFYTHTYDHHPFSYAPPPDVGRAEGWEALFTGELDLVAP